MGEEEAKALSTAHGDVGGAAPGPVAEQSPGGEGAPQPAGAGHRGGRRDHARPRRRVHAPADGVLREQPAQCHAAFLRPDPEALAHGGEPSPPRWVEDNHFDTLEQALEAAESQEPPADPYKWEGASEFRQTLPPEHELGPEAENVGRLPAVAGWATFAAAVYGGYRLNVWVGLNTAETRGSTADSVFTTVTILVSIGLGLLAYAAVWQFLRRRNLARAERSR
jgi:hypothetical protein